MRPFIVSLVAFFAPVAFAAYVWAAYLTLAALMGSSPTTVLLTLILVALQSAAVFAAGEAGFLEDELVGGNDEDRQ